MCNHLSGYETDLDEPRTGLGRYFRVSKQYLVLCLRFTFIEGESCLVIFFPVATFLAIV